MLKSADQFNTLPTDMQDGITKAHRNGYLCFADCNPLCYRNDGTQCVGKPVIIDLLLKVHKANVTIPMIRNECYTPGGHAIYNWFDCVALCGGSLAFRQALSAFCEKQQPPVDDKNKESPDTLICVDLIKDIVRWNPAPGSLAWTALLTGMQAETTTSTSREYLMAVLFRLCTVGTDNARNAQIRSNLRELVNQFMK